MPKAEPAGVTRRGALAGAASIIGLGLTTPTTAWSPSANDLRDRLDELCARAESNGFNGSVFVAVRGKRILHRAYGWADAARSRRVDGLTLFHVASLTKLFTATAAVKLMQAGDLRPDTTLKSVFPQAPPDKAGVTIEQLLTHASGLGQTYAADGHADRDAAVRAVLATKLEFPPGQQVRYSNDGVNLLGAIVEIVCRRPYADVLRRLVFRPAGLRRTRLWQEVDERSTPNLAAVLGEDGPHADGRPDWGLMAADGVWSTAGELGRFMLALRAGRVVSRAGFAELTRPRHYDDGDWLNYGWFTRASRESPRLLWMRGTEGNGHNAALYWYPEPDIVVAVVTNSGFERDRITVSRALSGRMEAAIFGERLTARAAMLDAYGQALHI